MRMGFIKKCKEKKEIARNKDTGTALERYSKSFFHAIDGMIYAFVCEHNLIIICLAAVLAIFLGFFLSISALEWLFVLTFIGLVSAFEFLNTALEAAIDLITVNFHPLAKIAKDTASSATLILSITALIGGFIIFLPKLLALI